MWDALGDLVRQWAPAAGSISAEMLRNALEDKGVHLDHRPRYARAFRSLTQASQVALDARAARLGRQLQLPRLSLRRNIIDAVTDGFDIVLTGRPGVGKSSVAKLAMADLQAAGASVVGLNLSGRTGSLHTLDADLGASLRDGLAGAPLGAARILLIDGAEQALTDAGHLLSSVLGAVPHHAEAPGWRLVLVARDEAAPTIARLAESHCNAMAPMSVGELSDDEVCTVVDNFPLLRVVQRNPRAAALLLRRPYLIELLIRAGSQHGLPAELRGEEDLIGVVMMRLVRRDNGGLPGRGSPEARADIWMHMADAAITGKLPVLLTDRDQPAREGLLSDDILSHPGQSSSFLFAHDVLLDYAVAARLNEAGGRELLAAAAAPRPLVRSVRLWMQLQVAAAVRGETVAQVWRSVMADAAALAARDGDRWLDVPYEALLHLGDARLVLITLTPALLADGGTSLAALIGVAQRRARVAEQVVAGGPVALDPALSGPVVDLLAQLGPAVPAACRGAALRLVHDHLAAGLAYRGAADTGLADPRGVPPTVIEWVGDADYGDSLELCTGALGLLAAHLTPDSETFLVRHAQHRPEVVAESVESPGAATALARSRPEVMLRLAGLFYLGKALTLQGVTGETTTPDTSQWVAMASITGDDAGIRDHDPRQARHLDMWPLGNNQSHPTMGPFLALLDTHPAEGVRLIGAVVDAATAARQQTENLYSPDEPATVVSLRYGGAGKAREFTGPATVWCWHRRTTVGPGPALSALMALRRWASRRIAGGEPIALIRDTILDAGTSVAFVSVAWFVMLEHLDHISDEMDLLLARPEVWDLELFRCSHESDLALDVPEMTRLACTAGDVAMQLALRGDGQRRDQLAEIGRRLIEHAAHSGRYSEQTAQLWAAALDVNRYDTRRVEGGVEVFVRRDPALQQGLADDVAPALRSMTAHALLREAVQMRDGQADLARAADLWIRLRDFLTESADIGIHNPADLIAAAAAGVIAAAQVGAAVDNSVVQEAVESVLELAAALDGAAPPAREALSADDSGYGGSYVRDMVWPDGFDRSIAFALPLLMADPHLAERASVSPAQLADALSHIAASPYAEARQRLADGLVALCDIDAADHREHVHEALLSAAVRMIRTAGYGPWNQFRGYGPATLPAPVEDALSAAGADELVLDLDGAAHAIAVLARASHLNCEHGDCARRLLDALIGHDERVWPRHYARHHMWGTTSWRQQIDRALAHRIVAGDDDCLRRHLAAFNEVAEQLTSLLHELARAATDAAQAARLHTVWPAILDALLPDSRTTDPDAYHGDIEELDQALLLSPEPDVDYWPWPDTVTLAMRWLNAYPKHAELADRAIMFALRLFGKTDLAALFVLPLLEGADSHWTKSSSRLTVEFLKMMLQQDISEATGKRLRSVLDGLARIGDERALAAQRDIENS